MMIKSRRLRALALGILLSAKLLAGPRDAEWKKYDEAKQNNLPKTEVTILETIYRDALTEKAYPEAAKALALKIAAEGQTEADPEGFRISQLQMALDKAPQEMRPTLETVLAIWYWNYFRDNRWKISQRTATTSAPSDDFRTWDLTRLLAAIDEHFSAALAKRHSLQRIPIAEYDALIAPASVPDQYRPTLYDFVAHQALQFYEAGETGAVIGENDFSIESAGPIFDARDAFLAWKPSTADASPKMKAIALLQDLLRFHQGDKNPAALFDTDMARLSAGAEMAEGENKEARYLEALKRLADESASDPISAQIAALVAQRLLAHDQQVEARMYAQRGYKAFPESAGGAACFNLIQQVEAKSLMVEADAAWSSSAAEIRVTYRNLSRLHFRVYPLDWHKELRGRGRYSRLDADERKKLLQTQPTFAWDAELPATPDFKMRTETLDAPTQIRSGYYLLIASAEATFAVENNALAERPLWVSSLALLVKPNSPIKDQSGLVVNAVSGEPIENAAVEVWQNEQNNKWKRTTTVTTDRDGLFHFNGEPGKSYAFLAKFETDEISSLTPWWFSGRDEENQERGHVTFFTDRAIYRPGQTVNFKGVATVSDPQSGKYRVAPGVSVTVAFSDNNGREIGRTEHVTSNLGSFSGAFTVPTQGVLGQMRLETSDGAGSVGIRVEEYKRPKFQVKLAEPAAPAKLGGNVEVIGHAEGYSGSRISHAKVKWRVERGTRFPVWLWWIRPLAVKQVAHGTAETDDDGIFKIAFAAAPDPAATKTGSPIFNFEIHADVTDRTGETRSDSRLVAVGYSALQASITPPDIPKAGQPTEFAISVSTLQGEPRAVAGKLLVYRLAQPAKVARAKANAGQMRWQPDSKKPVYDPAQSETWKEEAAVATESFSTSKEGTASVAISLPGGAYRAFLTTQDTFGSDVTARTTFAVIDPTSSRSPLMLANVVATPDKPFEVGQHLEAFWSTGYDRGRAFVTISKDGNVLKQFWTDPARTQASIEFPVVEELRGGFSLSVAFVRENRAYNTEKTIMVPWTNKMLDVRWETFRSKLEPGQKEVWTTKIADKEGVAATAEMVATMYDASLDQYSALSWPSSFAGLFRTESGQAPWRFSNEMLWLQNAVSFTEPPAKIRDWTYRALPPEIWGREEVYLSEFSVSAPSLGGYRANTSLAGSRAMPRMAMMPAAARMEKASVLADEASEPIVQPEPPPPVDLSAVRSRKNLNETAFFFPQLISSKEGEVELKFTMPEALTRWKFMAFAHDRDLRAGLLTDYAVTSKDLMVEPNPPRFLREGDVVEFTVKVSNLSEQTQSGKVRLDFADAATEKPLDHALQVSAPEQSFSLPAQQSRTFAWRISVPDGLGVITFKAVAASDKFSDGEENYLPVLSRRIAVAESLALPIRGKGTKNFELKKLVDSAGSSTLQSQLLTVQMVSQPAWYAVMALPYLMEYPYECSEQVFNRLYANQLAAHIAQSDPKIRRVFELWKTTSAVDSPLEKNQDVKSVLLEETPWLREAKSESESRKDLAVLFDENRLAAEAARARQTLIDRQSSSGLWSWFPGGEPSEYISLYIATGFGRMQRLGLTSHREVAGRAWSALDASMVKRREEILKSAKPEDYGLTSLDVLYLYGRSFFLKDLPLSLEQQRVVEFFREKGRKSWTKLGSRQSEAQLAIAFKRYGDEATAQAIMKSLKERAVESEELGMYWNDAGESWWWFRAPIETQAVMIEALDEVSGDAAAVEACKVWLLKQKQTQQWATTKSTADAIYALLLRGENLLANDALVDVALGGQKLVPEKVEAGTGFFEQKFVRSEIKPRMGQVTVTKNDDGVSWGSLHWQYLEDIAKVTPHAGTPLTLKKALFVRETNSNGKVMKPVSGPLHVGDELVVRIELRTDRDLEFVHLKDQRGSGTEPVNVLSEYKFQDGLGYYETTRDTATHFFIDDLRAGTYVFEYPIRVQLKGTYQSGIAEVQCMYAPEFGSHSESVLLNVE